jgi:hypothetical protein
MKAHGQPSADAANGQSNLADATDAMAKAAAKPAAKAAPKPIVLASAVRTDAPRIQPAVFTADAAPEAAAPVHTARFTSGAAQDAINNLSFSDMGKGGEAERMAALQADLKRYLAAHKPAPKRNTVAPIVKHAGMGFGGFAMFLLLGVEAHRRRMLPDRMYTSIGLAVPAPR